METGCKRQKEGERQRWRETRARWRKRLGEEVSRETEGQLSEALWPQQPGHKNPGKEVTKGLRHTPYR